MQTTDRREAADGRPTRIHDDARHRAGARAWLVRASTRSLIALVVVYQRVVSPWLPNTCRYEPSCSQYAREALAAHGPLKGTWLAMRRVGRCHPFGGQGYDPVPRAGDHGLVER